MDLGIESSDVLRPELAEGGSLARSQSTMFVAQRARGFVGHCKRIVDQV